MFVHLERAIEPVHEFDVHQDEDDEDVDGSLLGKPEPELESTDPNRIEWLDEEDAEAVGDDEPDG